MLDRFISNWAYAAPTIAVLLLGLYPFFQPNISLPIFLALPVYMLHQYEEHDDNRFALFLIEILGEGREGLGPTALWTINIIFVWFALLAVFYSAAVYPEWGVLAAYLLLTNGLLHIAWLFAFRKYNPGLWTAFILFIPLSLWIFVTTPASISTHLICLAIVVLLQAGFLLYGRRPKVGKH